MGEVDKRAARALLDISGTLASLITSTAPYLHPLTPPTATVLSPTVPRITQTIPKRECKKLAERKLPKQFSLTADEFMDTVKIKYCYELISTDFL